ncbi:type II secretion system F family protein [Halobacteriovorax vibrionivorans]|uniref:General secretion pathway protein F n=1 Tax=Halobacteriovorax vibrionivorans TaxID=2152716 RepID=A0ABY0IJT4_9BACT|nr:MULTISPECIES: type II secretion system F family protein [Halobacteriovorax]RZF23183.1 type II secretion system F family protein [Halobacteriovorax vibrionivorans]TGD46336.1 type II secretion system F family protein [Halobacteriovorax sp. Y22]
MPLYKWEGLDKNGKKANGQIQANSEKDAKKRLRAQGNRVRKIIPPSILEFDINAWLIEKGIGSAFGAAELMNFTKRLSIMINAGVPIILSLEIIYKSEKNPALKNAIKNIATDVAEGNTLAESMRKQQGFDNLYCNLVKAGEVGGILDEILSKLTEHLEKQEKIKKQIKSAMSYPLIVSGIGALVVWGLITYVVPQFTSMLTDTGQALPWITQFVIDTSDFFGEYSGKMILFGIAASMFLTYFVKTPQGKILFDKFSMNVPAFGNVIIKGSLAQFSRTLATLLGSGVALIDALEICIETIDNSVISNDIKTVRKKVVEGKTLTEPLSKIDYFPEMVAQMIKVGESTGSIDQMLAKISDVFEDEVNEAITGATKMLEPLVLVVLGGIIGGIMIAIYLPMFMSAGA